MKATLEVIGTTEVKKDKNGRNYQRVFLRPPRFIHEVDEITGEIVPIMVVNSRSVSINAYEKNYLNDQPDALFGAPKGTRVLGTLVTRKVKPYEIGERTVDKRTVPVFEDPSNPADFAIAVEQAFKNAGHEVVEEAQKRISKGEFPIPEKAVPETIEEPEFVEEEF